MSDAAANAVVLHAQEQHTTATVARGRLVIDPRVKLCALVVANLMMFLHVSPMVQTVGVLILSLPMLLGGRMLTALHMLGFYAILRAVDWASVTFTGSAPWLHFFGASATGLLLMLPCIIAGMSAFCTTRPGDLVAALRRLCLPNAIIIPAIVLLRFFPTIAHDYRMIRSSMKLRGICGFWRHPMRSLEYVLVPLLMNAANVARDLTISALTKGMGLQGTRSSASELRMRAADWFALALICAPMLLHILLP